MKDNKFYVTKDEFMNCSFDELENKAREQFKKGSNISKALQEEKNRNVH